MPRIVPGGTGQSERDHERIDEGNIDEGNRERRHDSNHHERERWTG